VSFDAAQVELDQDLAPELKLQPPDWLRLTVLAPDVMKPALRSDPLHGAPSCFDVGGAIAL